MMVDHVDITINYYQLSLNSKYKSFKIIISNKKWDFENILGPVKYCPIFIF